MQFSLFDLNVKALVQPLGNEDAWSELGDGHVELQNFTIRVTSVNSADSTPSAAEVGGTPVIASSHSPHVILEDSIAEDTPFVGENNCIVWNSLEQGLSLCIMFGTDLGFRAAWSALAAMQHKPPVPLEVDLFARCAPDPTAEDAAAATTDIVPYRSILHSDYQPPLGYIEKHCLAMSLVEYRHLSLSSDIFADKEVCEMLLKLGNADLVESLVHPALYPIFAKSLDASCVVPTEWEIPEGLQNTVQIGEDLVVCLRTILFLHHLRHNVLPIGIDEEIIGVVDGVQHRLLNELACGLLSEESPLQHAIQALHVVPTIGSPTTVNGRLSRSTTPTENVVTMPAEAAEKHVANHLKFLTNLISLCMTAFAKELVSPVMSKVFSQGLLEALSRVAERYTVKTVAPAPTTIPTSTRTSPENNTAILPPAPPSSSNGPRRPSTVPSAPQSVRSKMVEAELVKLLDCCVVRLNERQEELTLNDLLRIPMLDNPSGYAGLLAFLVRQLKDDNTTETTVSPSASSVQRGVGTNSFLLYHMLGLHDDEGSSSTERTLDPEQDAKRRDFAALVVKNFLAPACRTRQQTNEAPNNLCSAAFLRVLEYLMRLGSAEAQEAAVSAIVDNASTVLPYVDAVCTLALKNRYAVSHDVLCGIGRFLKELVTLSFGALSESNNLEGAGSLDTGCNEMSALELPLVPRLTKSTATRAVTLLFVERETIPLLLKLFQERGGDRRRSLFQSTVLSLLQTIRGAPRSTLHRDVTSLLMVRDRAVMPTIVLKAMEADFLNDVLVRLQGSKALPSLAIDKRAASPMSHGNTSCTSMGSPSGRFLNADEVALPNDAKHLEDVAAFPRRLRQAIGRLSPTPRGGLPDEAEVMTSPARELPPIPHMSSPYNASLMSPKGAPLLHAHSNLSSSPPPGMAEPLPLLDGQQLPPSNATTSAVKPTQPKQTKGNTGRSATGKHLNDGKPKVK